MDSKHENLVGPSESTQSHAMGPTGLTQEQAHNSYVVGPTGLTQEQAHAQYAIEQLMSLQLEKR